MYGTPKQFESVARDSKLTKPFYICEYAHAMFNSMGSLAEYSEMFDRNPEIGVRMKLDSKLDQFTFFGRGPAENYADRKTGFDVGLYSVGVNGQYEYEKPMERGNHEDVRWGALTGKGIPGLVVKSAGGLLQMAALPHTDEEMMQCEYKIDLPKSSATVLTVAAKTLGVGSNGCGPKPLDQYIVKTEPAKFSYVIKLTGADDGVVRDSPEK